MFQADKLTVLLKETNNNKPTNQTATKCRVFQHKQNTKVLNFISDLILKWLCLQEVNKS